MAERELSYAVVTPARNERTNLLRLAGAMRAQALRPDTWMIVDDGSTDGTLELARVLERAEDFIRLAEHCDERAGELARGRQEGRDLLAFRQGIRLLPRPVDVIVKVDADLSFEADYFRRLIERFAIDPKLGIASGSCLELNNGSWTRRIISRTSVWGASRAYRRDCLPVLMAQEARMGWDGLDEIGAQLRGYRTRTFVDITFRHHRAEGGRERGRLRAHTLLGRTSWHMGYRPSYLAARALYRSVGDPRSLAMLWGYLAAAAARRPRCEDRAVVAALRERQRARCLFATLRWKLGRGAPEARSYSG